MGHADRVTSVSFSPDGEYLASASRDNRIKLWSVHDDGRLSSTLTGHEHWVWSVAFSPNHNDDNGSGISRRLLASGSEDTTIRVWNAVTGQAELILT